MEVEIKAARSGDLPIGIIREQKNNRFHCLFCTSGEISQDWPEHIEKTEHVSAIRQFYLQFFEDVEEIDYKTCNASIDWERVKNHANWHKILPWYEIENSSDEKNTSDSSDDETESSEKFSVNSNPVKNSTDLSSLTNSNNLNDKEKLTIANNGVPEGCSLDDCIVILGRFDFCCKICRVIFGDQNEIKNHLRGEKHCTALKNCKEMKNIRGCHYDCLSCKCTIPNFAKVPLHVFGDQHTATSRASSSLWKSDSRELKRNYVIRIGQEDYYCAICNTTIFSMDQLDQHLVNKTHDDSLRKYGCKEFIVPRNRSDIFDCTCCNCIILDFDSLCVHITSRKHLKKMVLKRSDEEKSLIKYDEENTTGEDEETEIARKSEDVASTQILSTICTSQAAKSEDGCLDLESFFKVEDKLWVLVKHAKLCATDISLDGVTKYYCMVCKENIGKKSALLRHFLSLAHCEAFKIMRDTRLKYELVGETNSDNDLIEEFLEEKSEHTIYCYACDVEIGNSDELIEAHTAMTSHSEKRDSIREKNRQILVADFKPEFGCDWYDITKYFCALCDRIFNTEFEFALHAKSPEHVKSVENTDFSYHPLAHDFCLDCSLLWYGDCIEHGRHVKTSEHNKFHANVSVLNDITLTNLRSILIKNLPRIRSTLDQWVNIDLKPVLDDFKSIVQSIFPTANFLTTSDKFRIPPDDFELHNYEIFLGFGTEYSETPDDSIDHRARILEAALNKQLTCLSTQNLRCYARIDEENPRKIIITGFNYMCGKIRVGNDINIRRYELFRFLSAINGNLREMEGAIQTMTDRMLNHKLRSPITRSELLIFFLQYKSLFPPTSHFLEFGNLQPLKFKPGWHTILSKPDGWEEWCEKPKELVIEYHQFYANFDYQHEVACPWIGKTVKKQDFANPENLPMEMNYTAEGSSNLNIGDFFTPLCIQSELGLMENKTKGVTKAEVIELREYCSMVVKTLKKSK